jgi:hypothetical protein
MRWCKLSLAEVLVLIGCLSILGGLCLPTRDFDISPRFALLLPAPLVTSEPFKDIAGEYYLGDGLGVNQYLSILPDGRYSFVWGTCTGVAHRESGYIRAANDLHILLPVPLRTSKSVTGRLSDAIRNLCSGEPSPPKIERNLIPVPWDHDLYLIPPEKMETFCDRIIEGREQRSSERGSFYRRSGTIRFEQPRGLPGLPEKWAQYLDDRTILGRILAVNDDRVTINLGSVEGVRKDSVINVQAGDYLGSRRLGVITVDDYQCTAFDPYSTASHSPLEIGQGVIVEKLPSH